MEARIARLESDVAHLRCDLADVKTDDRLDTLNVSLNARIESLKHDMHSAKIWALLLYVALAAGMYATMARAFGWI